jgi:hypothetical protein
MQTGKAIVAGAIIIAATGAATAWAIQPRYSLTNVGGGASIRLNRASGDMIGCERLACAPIVKGDKAVEDRWWAGDPVANESRP